MTKYSKIIQQAKRRINTYEGLGSYDKDKFKPLCEKHRQDITIAILDEFDMYGKSLPAGNTLLHNIDNISKERLSHIINTFLLGIYLYDKIHKIKENIDIQLSDTLAKARHDFTFLWFLICLYHDLGYSEEVDNIEPDWTCQDKYLGSIVAVPKLYKEIYKYYFVYRKLEHNKIDHGIFAGLTMYKDLCKNREQKAREIKRADLWNPSLIPLYNLASWIVLAHNIWFVKDTDIDNCKIYQKYRLEQLILKTNTNNGQNEIANYPIKLSQHPLLFLFCLVDLIEPMKRIGCMDCCDKIDFRITKNKLIIKTNLDCNSGQEYIKNITSANDWLTITERNNNTVTIPLA